MNRLSIIKYIHSVHYVGTDENLDWAHEKARIRRMLRDPNGNIWHDSTLLRIYNDCQREIAQKTGFLDDIQAVRVPPYFDCSYLMDWEYVYLPSSELANFQALYYHEPSDYVLTARWEALVLNSATVDGEHSGYVATHPWEHFIALQPGEVIRLRLPAGFHRARLVAWDEEPIDLLTRKQITSEDASWLSRMGDPQGWWRPDELNNEFCLYPQASSATWDDTVTEYDEPVYCYTDDFEYTGAYISGTGRMFTRNYADDDVNYLWDWEYDHLDTGYASGNDEVTMRCMRLFEMETVSGDTKVGMLLFTDDDTTDRQTGTVIDSTDYLFNKDTGISLDTITAADNALFIFEKNPTDLSGGTDESDFPPYLRKYIEYATLERAYAVDNDGQIASLRDYWAMRKTIGLKAIKLFMGLRKADRNYRMTTKGTPGFRTRREPRLPDSYPCIYR